MWCLKHSNSIQKEEAPHALNLPATILLGDESGGAESNIREFETKIDALSHKGCTFPLSLSEEISNDTPILVNFDLNDKPMTCRAVIVESIPKSSEFQYRTSFKGLSQDDYHFLLRFTRKYQSAGKH